MLHRIAETYHQTPAAQLGIIDPLVAYALNTACLWAGLNTPKKEAGGNMSQYQKRGAR